MMFNDCWGNTCTSLAAGDKDEAMPPDAAKRHTMPPQPAPRPAIKDKKPPAGAVKVMPTPTKKEEKKIVEQRKPAENGTDTSSDPGVNNAETTPKKSKAGGFGLFGKKEKSPKEEKSPRDKSPKEKEKKNKDAKVKVAVLDTSNESSNLDSSLDKSSPKTEIDKLGFTKPYEYTDTETSPTRVKPFIQGAFSYEKEPVSEERQRALNDSQSPTTRKAALAFNYAPGEDKKVAESAEKRKSPEDPSKLQTPGIDYVQSAALKEQAKNLIDPTVALLNAERAHHVTPIAAPPLGKKTDNEIYVVIITGRYNPKTKKLDDANGTIHVCKGTINKANGKIQTEKENIDTKSGQINYTDPVTGKQESKTGHVESKTGHILLTSGVIDPKTGKIDTTLAQQYCFVEKSNDTLGAKPGRDVDLVVITGKYDGKHKKLDAAHLHVELSRAIVGPDEKVYSNYGLIDPKTGKIDYIDSKTGKQDPKQAYVDQKSGNILVTTAVVDPKSGKVDSSLGQQYSIVEKDARKANREVRLVVITSKYDIKHKKLDSAFVHVDTVKGILSGIDGKIYTDYGIIDPRTGTILVKDSKTGNEELKQAVVDQKTGNILLLSGVVDPRTGQMDTTLGQQYSVVDKPIDTFASLQGKEVQLVVITNKYDTKNKKLENPNGFVETSRAVISAKDGKVHTNFGILDPNTGKIHYTDAKTGKPEFKQAAIDSKTGSFIVTSGVIDPKTGKPESSLAQQLTVVDKDAPISERLVNLIVITSKYDPKNKKLDVISADVNVLAGKYDDDDLIHADLGILDPSSGQITVTDKLTGKQDFKKGVVDSKTGNILFSSGVVNPNTGKVDNNLGQQITVAQKPIVTFTNVPGKNVQLVVITGKYDSKNKKLDNLNGHIELSGAILAANDKIHSNVGIIDPKTGKIEYHDPKTGKQEVKQTVADPRSGHLLLTSGVLDPKTGKSDSSLAQEFIIIEKDLMKSLPEKQVNLVIITSKYDPRNSKLDPSSGHIDTVSGKLGVDGTILTEYGIINPSNGQIITINPQNGKQESKQATVDPKTGNLLLTSGVIDPETGNTNPNLGQLISLVDKPRDKFTLVSGKDVDLVVITNKYDPLNKNLENANGFVEVSRGIITTDDKLHSNFGIMDIKTGNISCHDPKTGKQDNKKAIIDTKTGRFLITSGVADPKTGKPDSSLAQQLTIVDKHSKGSLEKYVNLVIVTSKYDPKSMKLDPMEANVVSVLGAVGSDGKIKSDYGILDPTSGQMIILDPVTGKQEMKQTIKDPQTGNFIITSGVTNPKTGQKESSLAQQISIVTKTENNYENLPGKPVQLVIITSKYDLKNKKLDNTNGFVDIAHAVVAPDGKVHSTIGILDPKTGRIESIDNKTGSKEMKQFIIDSKTGNFIMTSGVIDPNTGKADPTLAQQLIVVNNRAGKISPDKYVNLVIITSKYDVKNKKLDISNAHVDTILGKLADDDKVYTDIGVFDPISGEIIVTDNKKNEQKIIKATVDLKTGNMLLTSGVTDPKTGQVDPSLGQQISIVDKPRDKFAIVPGKEVNLVVITNKYDPKNKRLDNANGYTEVLRGIVAADGKIHTNIGILDPKTGKIECIDPKTGKPEFRYANVDPKNGHFVLASGVADPKTGKVDSSLAQLLSVVDKEVKPIEREIHLVVVTTKYDPRTRKLDLVQSHVDTVSGSIGSDGKIRTSLGIIDPKSGDILITDPITGIEELKKAQIDPLTGHMLVTNRVVDPNTGKVDPTLVQQYSIVNKTVAPHSKPVSVGEIRLVIITNKYDPKTKSVDAGTGTIDASKGYISAEDGKIHTDFGIIDTKSGQILYKDPVTGKQELKQTEIDPKTGHIIVTTTVVNPNTGKVDTSFAQQLIIVDKQNLLPKSLPNLQRFSESPVKNVPLSIKTQSSTPVQTPLQSPARTSSPIVVKPVQSSSPTDTIVQRTAPKPSVAPPEPPKRKIVKIMVIFTKIDPKTKKPDLHTAEVEHLTGILDPSGYIETKYGILDPKKGTIVINNSAGQKTTSDGVVLPETGQIFIHSNVVDPKSGKVDNNLGIILSVAKQDDPVVEITAITGPIDSKTRKIDIDNGTVELTKGKVDAETGHIATKYGVIDPSNGVIFVTNTSGAQDTKSVDIDENTGQITITGVIDPKTGKMDPGLGQIIIVGTHIDPVVEVTTFVGKVDAKKGVIEPKHSLIESTTGQFNPENNKIDTKYGQIDLVKGTVTYNDPKTGKFESRDVKVDPVTGQLLLKSGQVNPKSGKPDKDIGRLICLRIIQNKVDPVSGKQIVSNDPKNIKVDPKTNQIWTTGPKDPQTGEVLYTAGQIDPTTGYIITIYGRLDPKTGTIVRTTDFDKSLVKVDPVNGQIYTSTGQVDENNQPLYSASQVDPATGEIYTKLGRIDPRTGRLVIVKIYVITQKDDKGRVKEVDPKECTIDESTGRIITTKTVYLYQIIDPITGETIDVDPDDPRLKGARTTVTQTMTLSGKIDPITGRIKTEYGDIDPDTGDIDPSTAVRDSVTGQLILHYSQIDPSHFEDKSGNYTIEKETQDLPANIDIQTVNTHKFSTFGKHDSPARGDEPKTFTEFTTSEHIRHQGFVSSTTPLSSKIPVSQRTKKTPTPPVVVKTTTKQLLTKNDEGVTHNVEREVENLGTGEVTFSTHTNKAETLEPTEGKSPYVTARAVTTRTATTHHDLDSRAKTQQMEEKTVAHTLSSTATRQEQRVLTQEVKTMVTTGDQEPGSYHTSTTSTVRGTAPFGGLLRGTARTSTEMPASEATPEGEVLSSQTISSKTRTVETITYKTERNGVVETRVEQKITIQSDGDPIDHDRALAEAIQEATAMNPDMTVEKIEIQQQSTQP